MITRIFSAMARADSAAAAMPIRSAAAIVDAALSLRHAAAPLCLAAPPFSPLSACVCRCCSMIYFIFDSPH
jgi:hypothetical protein